MEPSPTLRRAQRLLLIAIALVFLLTCGGYGITWDEGPQSRYGELTLKYYASGFTDREYESFLTLRYYGPLFETLAAIAYAPFPEHKFLIRRLLVGASAFLALVGVARLARRSGADPRLGLLAVVALVTLPRFYGHAFDNSKDMPFACAFTWFVVAVADWAEGGHRRGRQAVWAGLSMGAALGIRPGGALLLLPLLALAAAWPDRSWRERRTAIARRAGSALLIAGGAWLVLLAVWPWAQQHPFRAPLDALIRSTRFDVSYPVLFAGTIYSSSALPRSYLLHYLAISTPLPHLILAALGLILALAALRKGGAVPPPATGLTLAWIAGPLVLFFLARPNVYDGTRHFLFLYPAIALMTARGALAVLDLLARRVRRTLAGATVAVALAAPVVDMVRLHPYQVTYFNPLVGGLGGAWHRYETDYWLSSYREAMLWVNRRAAERSQPVTYVLVAANELSRTCAEPYAAPTLRLATVSRPGLPGELPAPFDFYVATTRFGLAQSFPLTPVVHTVGRDGAVFAVIRERRPRVR